MRKNRSNLVNRDSRQNNHSLHSQSKKIIVQTTRKGITKIATQTYFVSGLVCYSEFTNKKILPLQKIYVGLSGCFKVEATQKNKT